MNLSFIGSKRYVDSEKRDVRLPGLTPPTGSKLVGQTRKAYKGLGSDKNPFGLLVKEVDGRFIVVSDKYESFQPSRVRFCAKRCLKTLLAQYQEWEFVDQSQEMQQEITERTAQFPKRSLYRTRGNKNPHAANFKVAATRLREKFFLRRKMQAKRVDTYIEHENLNSSVVQQADQPLQHEWSDPSIHTISSLERTRWKLNTQYALFHMRNHDILCEQIDENENMFLTYDHISYTKVPFSVTDFYLEDSCVLITLHTNGVRVIHRYARGKWQLMGEFSHSICGLLTIDDYVTQYRWQYDAIDGSIYTTPDGYELYIPVSEVFNSVSFEYKQPKARKNKNRFIQFFQQRPQKVSLTNVVDQAAIGHFETEVYKFVYEYMGHLADTGITDAMLVVGRVCNALYLIANAPSPTYCFWLVVMIVDNFIAQYRCDSPDIAQMRSGIVAAWSSMLGMQAGDGTDTPPPADMDIDLDALLRGRDPPAAPLHEPPLVETVYDQNSTFSTLMKFQSIVTGPLLNHLDTLACFMVTIGFVNPTCIRIRPFEDYRLQCKARTSTVTSFIEKVVVSAEYLWTTGYNCFATRSFDPIFGSSDALTAVQNDHAHLKNNIDLVLNGTYEQITGKTTWEYDQELARLEKQVNLMKLNVENSSQLKSLLSLMSASISNLQQRVLSHKQSMGTRMEPFAIKLYGGSSVGKSVLTEHAVRAILVANGISCEPKHIITIDHSDRFDSNFRGDATCYIADDLANAYADYEVKDSSNLVIRMVNSVQTMAIMPEAQDKGRVPIAPFLFVATTNRQNLNALETSTTPASVLRRFHIHATVRVKPAYAGAHGMLDKSKVPLAPKFDGVMPDLQLIDVTIPDFNVKQLPHGPLVTPSWFAPYWPQPTLTGLNMKQFLLYACMLSKRHKAAEDARMSMRDTVQTNPVCGTCKCPSWVCACVRDQSGFLDPVTLHAITYGVNFGCGFVYDTAKTIVNTTIQKVFPSPVQYSELRALKKAQLVQEYLGLNDCTNEYKWWHFVPAVLIKNNPWFDYVYSHIERNTAALQTLRQARAVSALMVSTLLLPKEYRTIGYEPYKATITRPVICGFSTVFIGMFTFMVHKHNKKMVEKALIDRKIDADQILDQARVQEEHTMYKVMRYASLAAGIGAALMALRLALQKITDQSLLSPENDEEFADRSAAPNMWFKPSVATQPKGTSVPTDLGNMVSKNLMAMKYTTEGLAPMYCDCLVLDSDHLLMNKHVWFYAIRDGVKKPDISGEIQDKITFEFIRGMNKTTGDVYYKTFTKDDVICLKDSDLVVVCNAVNGPRKSLLPFFIKESEYSNFSLAKPAIYVHRNYEGKRNCFHATLESQHLEYPRANGKVAWDGFKAYTDHTWIDGDCGAVAISHCMPPRILGMHAIGVREGIGFMTGRTVLCTYEMLHPILSKTFDVTPLEIIPPLTCGQVTDMAREVPQIHFVNQCDYSNRFELLGYKVNIASYATKVRPTRLVPLLKERGHGDNMWMGPNMRFKTPWKPFMTFMDKAMDPMHDLPSQLLLCAKIDYVCGFMKVIRNNNPDLILQHFSPLTNQEILNGREGVRFMEAMSMSTSCCYPFTGKKRNKLVIQTLDEETGKLTYILQPDKMFLWEQIAQYEDELASGQECFFPFVSQQKDEIVPKIRKGARNEKVRVFQSSCLPLSFIMRKYFLPVVRLLGMYPLVSECMVGINPFGFEFTEVFEHLVKYGEDRLFAGDYSSWDQKVSSQLSESAFDAIVMIAEQCAKLRNDTYTNRDLTIMKTLKYAVTHAIIICHGAVIRFHGTNPSGQTITTHLNSVMNSLLIRVATYHYNPRIQHLDFRAHLAVLTYGDDINAGVAKGVDFNFDLMATYLASKNLSFTTDKKDAGANVTFMPIQEITFLKRSYVYHPKIGAVLGALDITSMYKCLYNWLKKDVTEMEVLTSNFTMFAQELFGHGEKHYDLMLPEINSLARQAGIFLPLLEESYKDRAEKWFAMYRPKETYADYCRLEDSRARMWTQIHTSPPEALYRFPWVGVPEELRPGIINYLKSWLRAKSETSDGFTGVESDDIDSLEVCDQSAVVQVEQTKDTLQSYDRKGINFNSTYGRKVDIEQWLSRPVLVDSFDWQVGAVLGRHFNPLQRFLENRAVARKVANYRYISGTMHFKVVTTGTMSHWGRIIVATEPWPLSQVKRVQLGLTGSIPAATIRQCVHLQHVMVDPAAELAGEMSAHILCPHDNKIIIKDAARVAQCCVGMHVRTISPLNVMNAGNGSVNVRIYMHMTNVVLTGAVMDIPLAPETDPDPEPEPESLSISNQNDVVDQSSEFPNGIISAPSSLAADVADVMGEAFNVTAYTAPVSSGLRKASKIASMLGYSNPSSAEPPVLVARRTFNPLATVNCNATIEKLSLDVKQGINVDSESSGIIESDPTLVASIAGRDHLNMTIPWSTNSATGVTLYKCIVAPQQTIISGLGGPTQCSPAAWLTGPFELWRGTMIIRVEIIGCAFHRGKLRVVYDPSPTHVEEFPASVFDNENYSQIIDITKTRSYEFCIGWNTHFPWLLAPELTKASTDQRLSSPVSWPTSRRFNGVVSIVVEAPLTLGATISTAGDSDCDIAVFSRWDKDFAVASPRSTIRHLVYEDQSASLGDTPSSVRQEHISLCLNEVPMEMDNENHIHGSTVGERVYSIREIVKRPTLHCVYSWQKTTVPTRQRYQLSDFPAYRGPAFRVQPSGGSNSVKVSMTLLNWFARPYLGYTGSIRWKYAVFTHLNHTAPVMITASRFGIFGGYFEETITGVDSAQPLINRAMLVNALSTNISGAASIFSEHNRVLEVDLPFVYDGRYKICYGDKTEDDHREGPVGDETYHLVDVLAISNIAETYYMASFASGGDDMNFYAFRYIPLVRDAGNIPN